MARTRFLGMAVLSVALLATQRQAGLAQYPKEAPPPNTPTMPKPADPRVMSLGVANDLTCKVYTLSDLGADPSLGKWVAETIPEVIQPGSWNAAEPMQSRRKINYHAASKILVIYHTAAVHAKVDAFLNDLKNALPRDNARTTAGSGTVFAGTLSGTTAIGADNDRRLQHAQYTVPAVVKQSESLPPQASGYPVAAPLKQPKHLFHFIIRYEGEGLIDANVVKFAKAVNSDNLTRNSMPATYALPMTNVTVPATVAADPQSSPSGSAPPNSIKSGSENPSYSPARPQPSAYQPPSAAPPPPMSPR